MISALLKAENNNSIGAASYECGPVKIVGISYFLSIANAVALVWYEALSSRITVLVRHLLLYLSSLCTNFWKNKSITLEFEFA